MVQKAVGIVSEFNPFHLGHQYLIEKVRERFGEDTVIVCVMSGDYVQRGDIACFSKFARAEAACHGGADLVVELPLPWSIASAETFAYGAVQILQGLNGITALAFGSECGNSDRINECAKKLLSEELEDILREELKENKNYALARQKAMETIDPALAKLLEQPNNILAVEYAKAVERGNAGMELFTVRRIGEGHDQTGAGRIRSAKELREKMCSDDPTLEWLSFVPESVGEVFQNEMGNGRGPIQERDLEQAILARLRQRSREEILNLPDVEGGLGELFYRSIYSAGNLNDLIWKIKHKNIALSRVRRLVYASAIGISGEMMAQKPQYIRLLALNSKGKSFLHDVKPNIPVVSKPAQLHHGNESGKKLFNLGSAAHDLYVLGYHDSSQWICGEDWKTGPAVLV